MDTQTAPSTDDVYVLARDEGPHMHFLNNLATIKVAPGSSGSMSAVEFLAPKGFGPPVHVHRDEDEIVVVLDGEIAFQRGGEEIIATTGALAYLPHGVSHTFQVLSDTARMLSVTASAKGTPEFDLMVASLGEPTSIAEVPEPMDIDPAHVAQMCGAHGVDIVGPPPEPLAN